MSRRARNPSIINSHVADEPHLVRLADDIQAARNPYRPVDIVSRLVQKHRAKPAQSKLTAWKGHWKLGSLINMKCMPSRGRMPSIKPRIWTSLPWSFWWRLRVSDPGPANALLEGLAGEEIRETDRCGCLSGCNLHDQCSQDGDTTACVICFIKPMRPEPGFQPRPACRRGLRRKRPGGDP